MQQGAPRFSFEMSNGKRRILEAVSLLSEKKEGKVEVADIAKKLNCVDKGNRITEAGRIALLWKGGSESGLVLWERALISS
ncbi:MAG: hypothetical protein N3E51_04690 [Candidatus Micrarchaeota archaeon]|nr:hypothetical protein [Candidatus Micrarchaeota archaeon]